MNPRNLLFTVAAVIVLGATFTLRSQGLTDGIKVTLPQPVTVGDVVLDPGEYEIRRASIATDQVLRIFSNDKLRYQTNVLTIPVLDKDTPEKTRVILHHIGDQYYFDKIWMEGKDYGYEFVLPGKVRALQKELAVTVPARYESTGASAVSSSVEREQPAPTPAEGSTQSVSSAEQDRQRADALAREQQEARDREGRERQEQAERDRVAALQREPAPAAQNPADARQDRPAAVQDNARARDNNQQNSPDQLPATASDWLSYVVGGCVLLGMAAFFRKPRTQE